VKREKCEKLASKKTLIQIVTKKIKHDPQIRESDEYIVTPEFIPGMEGANLERVP
jgi:hypothetical protein